MDLEMQRPEKKQKSEVVALRRELDRHLSQPIFPKVFSPFSYPTLENHFIFNAVGILLSSLCDMGSVGGSRRTSAKSNFICSCESNTKGKEMTFEKEFQCFIFPWRRSHRTLTTISCSFLPSRLQGRVPHVVPSLKRVELGCGMRRM